MVTWEYRGDELKKSNYVYSFSFFLTFYFPVKLETKTEQSSLLIDGRFRNDSGQNLWPGVGRDVLLQNRRRLRMEAFENEGLCRVGSGTQPRISAAEEDCWVAAIAINSRPTSVITHITTYDLWEERRVGDASFLFVTRSPLYQIWRWKLSNAIAAVLSSHQVKRSWYVNFCPYSTVRTICQTQF